MKIAIFHNYLDNIGGAEMVSLILAKELGADIYTTNIDKEKIKKMGFEDILPRIFSIGSVPINAPLRQQIAFLRFRFLKLKNKTKYDYFIICGDWAMSGAVNNKPNLWYVHSPIREIWDLYKYTRQNTVPWFLRLIFDLWVFLNRSFNKKYIKSAEKIVCNSQNTKNRIKEYLKRDAQVIYPPIETSKFHYIDAQTNQDSYWLSINRLIDHKRIDLQLKSFSMLPDEKLIIVGSYEKSNHFQKYANYCKKIKPDNVEIKSWVSEEEKIDLLSNCKGFITTSKNEDFGMNVVEAMASGKPVIAPAEGGYLETVINGVTGVLIDDIDEFKLVAAIKSLSPDIKRSKDDCIKQAKRFDETIFIDNIVKQIKNAQQV